MALTKEQRDALDDGQFAVPGKRMLPIHDDTHVRMAWSMLPKTQGLTDEERSAARRKIIRKAHELGLNTDKWEVSATSFTFEAMALDMPTDEHPNKMPFKGILTRLDQSSDAPPNGSNGRRTFIPKDVAEAAIPSLLGMAVDYTPDFDGHDKRAKIGLITEAYIEGDALWIAGFFYANDFPDECQRIRAEKSELGWSYECKAAIRDVEADPWVIDYCVFTGAAVLYKALAAYTTTSLEAQAQVSDTEVVMNEELKKLLENLSASVASIGQEVAALKAAGTQASQTIDANAVKAMCAQHSAALRSAADGMENAGIGLHASQGHVAVLRRMAASMDAAAATGQVPHIYRDHDFLYAAADNGAAAAAAAAPAADSAVTKKMDDIAASVASLGTVLADLQAKAFNNAPEPGRKTISPEIKTLLAKAGIGEEDAATGKVTVETLDKCLDAAGIKGTNAIATKLKLREAGLLN